MKHQRHRRLSDEEKKTILQDYLGSDLSQEEIALKYGLPNRSCLSLWARKYSIEEKCVPLPPSIQTTSIMKLGKKEEKPDYEKLSREELIEVAKRRDLQLEALEMLIKLAEDNGMPVRKNSGAKW